MTRFEYIQFEIYDRLAYITLNRLDARNALNFAFIKEIKDALSIAEYSEEVKIIIIKANGEIFSSGYDLAYIRRLQNLGVEENLYDVNHICDLFMQMYKLRKVIVSQIEGDAYATGAGLATFCDISFAVPAARLIFNEVKYGFIPAVVAPFLARRLGDGRARELLLTGDAVSARRAYEIGLINYIEEPGRIAEKVKNFALRLCRENSIHCMDLAKRMLGDFQDMTLIDAVDFNAKLNARVRVTDECKFGVDNFLTKGRFEW